MKIKMPAVARKNIELALVIYFLRNGCLRTMAKTYTEQTLFMANILDTTFDNELLLTHDTSVAAYKS